MEVWFRWIYRISLLGDFEVNRPSGKKPTGRFFFPNWVILSFQPLICSNIFGPLEPKKMFGIVKRRLFGTCWRTRRYVNKQAKCLVNLVSRGNCSKPVFTFFIWCYLGNGNFGNYIWIKACMKKPICDSRSVISIPRIRKLMQNSLRGRGPGLSNQHWWCFFRGKIRYLPSKEATLLVSPQNNPTKKSRKIISMTWNVPFENKCREKKTWIFFLKNQATGRNLTYLEDPGIYIYI